MANPLYQLYEQNRYLMRLSSLFAIFLGLIGLGLVFVALTVPGKILGVVLFEWSPGFLNTTQAIIQRYISAGLWDVAFLPLLMTNPLFAGLILLVIAGVMIFRNARRSRR